MKQVIPERHARRQYRVHLSALLLLALAALWPESLLWPAAAALLVSSLYLEWNLLVAMRLYQRLIRSAERD